MYIDTHAHLNFSFLLQNLDQVLLDCDNKNISKLVIPSVDFSSWESISLISASNPQIYPAYGLHPLYIDNHKLSDLDKLKVFADKYGAVAVGEIGLDKRVGNYSKQIQFLEAQLSLAEEMKLPVILHCVKAHDDILSRLSRFELVGGVIHAFSGSEELLLRYVSKRFYIGVGGLITRANAKKVRRAIASAPLDYLVLETDSPDMTVGEVARGESSPADILTVFQALCSLREESSEALERAIWANSLSLFPRISV